MIVCTTVSAGTRAAGRVLVASVREHHPDADVRVLAVDGGPVEDGVALDALGLDPVVVRLRALALGADGFERWLAPRLVAHLAASGSVVHLAPTMRLYAPIELPYDGGLDVWLRPGDRREAGLVRGGPELGGLLPAGDDPDPDWLDRVVGAAPVRLLGPEARIVSATGTRIAGLQYAGVPTLDGSRVAVVDFEGFDADRPWLLSWGSAPDVPVLLSEHPALLRLTAQYAAELRAARLTDDPAEVTALADGTRVDDHLRAVVTDGWTGAIGPPPDPADAERFTRWLTEPDEHGVGRYLRVAWERRADLRAAFPSLDGGGRDAFLAWAAHHAAADGFDRRLVDRSIGEAPRTGAVAAPRTRPARPGRPGLNVVGYLSGELGIGEAARRMVDAARAVDLPVSSVPVTAYLSSRTSAALPTASSRTPDFDTTLLCVNADLTPAVAGLVPDAMTGRYRIGMWYWEVATFPESLHGGFAPLDEVWVATEFVRDAIAPHTDKPVVVVPPPLWSAPATDPVSRADLGLPEDRFVFLFVFDYLSTAERKNPVGLVEAFRRAFPDGGPLLVVKTINADVRPADAERLRLLVAGDESVLLMEHYLSTAHRDALMARCDAYVSLHRSEGFGLTIAEAMSAEKPVLATAYGGNVEFMSEHSYFVPYALVDIPADAAPYPAGTPWADPDLDVAADIMRRIVANPDEAAERGRRAAVYLRAEHGAEASGRRLVARLAEIRASRPPSPRTTLGYYAAAVRQRLLGRHR